LSYDNSKLEDAFAVWFDTQVVFRDGARTYCKSLEEDFYYHVIDEWGLMKRPCGLTAFGRMMTRVCEEHPSLVQKIVYCGRRYYQGVVIKSGHRAEPRVRKPAAWEFDPHPDATTKEERLNAK
jgi:hypothetical protein